jgi:trehalose/maltose hydrolase-like predicted phosphorylase
MSLIAEVLTKANMYQNIFSQPPNTTWSTRATNVAIERDPQSGISLEYSGMDNFVQAKQADVVLKAYPLGYEMNYTAADAQKDAEYYATSNSPRAQQ